MNKRKLILICVICIFSLKLFARQYGLVLSGGGGKGAYEVGVWKALQEFGIANQVSVISGTSVGGLNAALFSIYSQEEIENLWKNDVPDFLVPDEDSNELYISQSGLEKLILLAPVENIKKEGFPRIIVSAVRSRFRLLKKLTGTVGTYTHRFVLNNENPQEARKMLLATAAMPYLCSPVVLFDGYSYVDGGGDTGLFNYGGDNLPIEPIYSPDLCQMDNADSIYDDYSGITDIIVVYLEKFSPETRRIRAIDYDRINLIEISPAIDLGSLFEGTVNFTYNRINLLIQKGYEDACSVLTLKGYRKVSSHWFKN